MLGTVSDADRSGGGAVSRPNEENAPKKRPLVITTCSAAKRQRLTAAIHEIARGPQADVAQKWVEKLREDQKLHPLDTVYGGRAFQTARQVADSVHGDLGVISAGLGYLRNAAKIPGYDLTVRDVGPGSVRRRIKGDFDAQKWWRSVSSGPFASSLTTDVIGRPVVLICISRGYAELIREELNALTEYRDQLRIFGLSISEHLPERLRDSVMPYDERLSGIDGGGTRVDFAQRALQHYVTTIHPFARGSLAMARQGVERALSGKKRPVRHRQVRMSDEQVTSLIRKLWSRFGRNYGDMLHHIRNELHFSCEQSRFAKLFRKYKEGLAG